MSTLQYTTSRVFHGGSPEGRRNSQAPRQYFFIIMISGEGSISFGEPGEGEVAGEIPLKEGSYYSPTADVNGKIRVTTVGGVYVVHTDLHNTTAD